MAARRVICPDCQTTLQLPESSGALKIKCPKCGKVLSIGAAPPAAPQRPAASQGPAAQKKPVPQKPVAPAGSFVDLSGLPPPAAPGRSPAGNFPLTPSSISTYQLPKSHQPKKSKPVKQGSGGGSSTLVRVFAILGAIAGVGVLLCAGLIGLAATGVIGARHSGWEPATIQGVNVKMPKAGKVTNRTTPAPGVMVYEIITQRRESGSQYILAVAKFTAPELQALSIQQIIELKQMTLSNRRSVTRSGVTGVAGTVASIPDVTLLGAEVELFARDGTQIIMAYMPYSVIKDRVGGKMTPRRNERDLDKPEEFFESLGFL